MLVADTTHPTLAPVVAAMQTAMRLPPGSRVAVAMSGGVDSSTVAALLVEAGYRVFGLTARLYDVDPADLAGRRSGTCCAPEDARDARSVAQGLGIRHYVLDEREAFRTEVIDQFVGAWQAGETPNPCVECNRSLKFDRLVLQARALGAEALATGHYARLTLDAHGLPDLRRAVDRSKDQSYFLYPLQQEAGSYLRFPIGDLTKAEVRRHAERLGLATAQKAESMDICFVGNRSARAYVEARVGAVPGHIVDAEGTRLGQHAGIAGFTVGQRHGLGLPARAPGEAPRFVLDKRADGTVVVGDREALRVAQVTLGTCNWLTGKAPCVGQDLELQVRHRGAAVAARVRSVTEAGVVLDVQGDLYSAGRGQAGVVYEADRVLGGGTITDAQAQPAGGRP